MPNVGKELAAKFLNGIVEALTIFPVLLILGVYFIPNLTLWLISLPILFLIGLILRAYLVDKKRWVYVLGGLIVTILLALVLFDVISSIIIGFVSGYLFYWRGILYAEFPNSDEVRTPALLWVSFPLYFVAYFFFRFVEALNPYLGVATWAGVITLFVVLLVSNNSHLKSVTFSNKSKQFINRTVRNNNRFFIITIFILALLIGNFRAIQEAFYKMNHAIVSAIMWFVELFGSEGVVEEEPTDTPAQMPFMEKGEPSAFAELMEKIILIVGYAALVLLGLFLIYLFIKKGKYLFKKVMEILSRFLNQILQMKHSDDVGGHFIDEKESVIDWKEGLKDFQARTKDWITNKLKREPRYEDLQTNQERIRYLYRHFVLHFVKGGSPYVASKTPKEWLLNMKQGGLMEENINTDALVEAYCTARYGHKEIRDEELVKIKREIKDVIG